MINIRREREEQRTMLELVLYRTLLELFFNLLYFMMHLWLL